MREDMDTGPDMTTTTQSLEGRTGANGQAVEILTIGGQRIEVDTEIADLVRVLNDNGYPTRASCSGHGRLPASIILQDGRELHIARNRTEGRMIEALFRTRASEEG